jgi:hypothetical protein
MLFLLQTSEAEEGWIVGLPLLSRADLKYPRVSRLGFIESSLAAFPYPGLDGCPLGSKLHKCLAPN